MLTGRPWPHPQRAADLLDSEEEEEDSTGEGEVPVPPLPQANGSVSSP